MRVLITSDVIIKAFPHAANGDPEDQAVSKACERLLDLSNDRRIRGYMIERTLEIVSEAIEESNRSDFIKNISNKVKVCKLREDIGHIESTVVPFGCKNRSEEARLVCCCAYEDEFDAIVTTEEELYKTESRSRSSLNRDSNNRNQVEVLSPQTVIKEQGLKSQKLRNWLVMAGFAKNSLTLAGLIGIGILIGGKFIQGSEKFSSTVSKVCGIRIKDSENRKAPLVEEQLSQKTKEGLANQKIEEGLELFKGGNYKLARNSLCEALELNRNNPKTVIYLNNLYLSSLGSKTYTIAVLTPVADDSNDDMADLAEEVLRGVAQAQDEINDSPERIQEKGLKIIIDEDRTEKADETAQKIADKTDAIAVIGPFRSSTTIKTFDTYQRNRVAFVSPTSTSEEFSEKCQPTPNSESKFCFRTVPGDKFTTERIIGFLMQPPPEYRSLLPVAIFYSGSPEEATENNPCSPPPGSSDLYAYSLRSNFCRNLANTKKENSEAVVVKDFNLSSNKFKAEEAVNKAQAIGAKTLILFPGDDKTSIRNTKAIIQANQKGGKSFLIGGDSFYRYAFLEEGKSLVGSPPPFLFVAPWIRSNSPEPDTAFLKSAGKLWGTFDISWVTATSYDATRILIAALAEKSIQDLGKIEQPHEQIEKIRVELQRVLVNQKINGATGEVSFDRGNRREVNSELIAVEPTCLSGKAVGYRFVRFDPKNPPKDRCP